MVAKATEPVYFETLTPSGIAVRYSPSPKRKYEVVMTCEESCQACDTPEECTALQWREVPSVTTVLGVLDKPALPWWGMKQGVEGTLELHRRNLLRETMWWDENGGHPEMTVPGGHAEDWGVELATTDKVVALLNEHKLTVNHARDKAGDRGTAVHDAFELWAREGHMPDPQMFPPEEQGYVAGLVAFLKDVNPEPLDCEVMVGSVEHGFAGRYDVRLRINEERQVVFHRTPKKGPQYAVLSPGVMLADLKTSSGTYPSHALQLAAYELASVECGYEATDARGVIHVSKDGTYELVRAKAAGEDFLSVLDVWNRFQGAKAWLG